MEDKRTHRRRRHGDLQPNPRMWAALRDGVGLSEVLDVFYTRVLKDERMAPFFEGVSKQRIAEKQYSFMRQIFTGERIYFGDRPRNAHSWMVISDELFDYREELLAQCLREYGLSEDLIEEWRAVDEIFRKQIVKTKAFGRKIRGVEAPVDGYERESLSAGTLCDVCSAELNVGTVVSYHRRTGKVFCSACMPAP